MARALPQWYVETYRPGAPLRGTYVRAHHIKTGKPFNPDVLSPDMTALFHVTAPNALAAIAMVCEKAAGMDVAVNHLTPSDYDSLWKT